MHHLVKLFLELSTHLGNSLFWFILVLRSCRGGCLKSSCFNRKWGQEKYIDSSLVLYSPCNKIPSTAIENLFELLTKQSALPSICNIFFPPTQSFFNEISVVNKEEQSSTISSICFVECHRFLIQVFISAREALPR